MNILALLALVLALVGTICCALSHRYGGPLLPLGATLIGIAVVILALPGVGLGGGDEVGSAFFTLGA